MENQSNQIIESYKQFWIRFLDVKGRSDRADYWHPFWINFLISTVLGALSGGLLSSIFGIAIIIPSFTVMVRRLHDTNRTMLFAIISYISGFIASVGTLVFFFGVVRRLDTRCHSIRRCLRYCGCWFSYTLYYLLIGTARGQSTE